MKSPIYAKSLVGVALVELSHYQKYGRKHYFANHEKYKERARSYYQRSKHLKRAHYLSRRDEILRSRYGINENTYNEMYSRQEGLCAICGTHKDRLDVDHCHTTNKVRGLLCNNCNRGIGHLQEDVNVMTNAIKYLTNSMKHICEISGKGGVCGS